MSNVSTKLTGEDKARAWQLAAGHLSAIAVEKLGEKMPKEDVRVWRYILHSLVQTMDNRSIAIRRSMMSKNILVTLKVQFAIEAEDETDDVAVENLIAEMEREMPVVAVGGNVSVESVEPIS